MSNLDLTPFLSTDYDRPYLCEPITRGGHTYYADGHVMVRTPAAPDAVESNAIEAERPMLGIMDQECTATLPDIVLPESDPSPAERACRECDGVGYLRSCTHCDGRGETACCECGSDKECSECDGCGGFKINIDAAGHPAFPRDHANCFECENCEGAGKLEHWHAPYIYCEIAPGLWINSTIYRRLHDLPNLRFCPTPSSGQQGPSLFRFDGGEGCFMPMRPPGPKDIVGGEQIAAIIPLASAASTTEAAA